MKFLLFIFFFITVYFFDYSIERTISNYEDIMSNETITTEEDSITTTTSWWTRTFPIIITRTARPRSRPPLKTTTVPIRISKIISITIPAVLFGITILVGFGLIIFSLITHGNGISFLTRTNEHRLH